MARTIVGPITEVGVWRTSRSAIPEAVRGFASLTCQTAWRKVAGARDISWNTDSSIASADTRRQHRQPLCSAEALRRRPGSGALVLAMLAACPESPSSNKVEPSLSAAAPPAVVAARPRIDAGTVVVPEPAENAPADFRGALVAIHVTNPEQNERLAWLAKDFGSRVFRQADRVNEAHLHTALSSSKVVPTSPCPS